MEPQGELATKTIEKIEQLSIDDLIPYARNSRTHSEEQILSIAASIKEFSFTNPILIDADGGIIAGHGRVLAARKLNMTTLPCVRLSHLTETQKRAYIIADNKLTINGGWDDAMLALEFAELDALDFDLELTGFSLDEIELLNPEEIPEGLTDEDEVPELPGEPITKLGDVWLCGRHRVMCGDSTSIDAVEKLMNGNKADFCFTSPPYNAAMTCDQMHSSAPKAGIGGLYVGGYTDDRTADEFINFNIDIITAMSIITASDFTCCYNINYNKNSPSQYIDVIYKAKQIIPLVETIIWEKSMAVSLQGDNLTRIFEFVFVLCKGKFKINKNRTDCLKNLWKISNIGANHETHKACFPVALVEEGIKNFSPHGGKIYEPFGGSGTTIIASERLGCIAHMMELDPKYCDVIVTRWQAYTGLQSTLESTGELFNG